MAKNDYRDTLDYLFSLQRVGIKLGLDNIRALLAAVGEPQTRWPAIHIAGTNGKGSSAAMLESILLGAGYTVGLYTSPHLIDFSERIRVNRQAISTDVVVEFTRRLRPLIDKIEPSFFEVTTALAFWHFAQHPVEVAVVETGMGGRLDSTNVLAPLVSLITPVDYDHQQYLGNTLKEIAAEKGGIIKTGVPCLTNNRHPEVLAVLAEICRSRNAPFCNVFEGGAWEILHADLLGTCFNLALGGRNWQNLALNLPGDYQMENVLLVMAALEPLKDYLSIPDQAVVTGLNSVLWKGRLHLVSTAPPVMIDVSHNPAGFERTLRFIGQFFPKSRINAITFLQEDKDFRKIGDLLIAGVQEIFIMDLPLGKPLNPQIYRDYLQEKGGSAQIVDSFETMRERIFRSPSPEQLWLIIGSHYLAGEAYQTLP